MRVVTEHEYKEDQVIFFKDEKLPFTIQAISSDYAICTRPIDKSDNSWLDKPFDKYSKDTKVYTIIDFQANWRGPDDYVFSDNDYKTKKDCQKGLKAIEDGEFSVSKRRGTILLIDTYKTAIYLHKALGLPTEDR